jgi:hypothetical protein
MSLFSWRRKEIRYLKCLSSPEDGIRYKIRNSLLSWRRKQIQHPQCRSSPEDGSRSSIRTVGDF